MNRVHVLSLSALLLLPAIARADLAPDVRALPAFRNIDVHGGIQVEAKPGEQHLELRGDPADLADVLTEVTGETLSLDWKRSTGRSHHAVTVLVSVPKLDALSVQGGAHAKSENLGLTALSLSGGSTAQATGLSQSLAVAASGGGHATLSGAGATTLTILASGGSQIEAMELPAQTVTVNGSGGSRVEVQAKDALTALGSGGTTIEVQGHPKAVTQHVSGGSTVSFR